MDKSLSVAAAKRELHASLESKDEELAKANDHIKELDAENIALKHNISQGCFLLCCAINVLINCMNTLFDSVRYESVRSFSCICFY